MTRTSLVVSVLVGVVLVATALPAMSPAQALDCKGDTTQGAMNACASNAYARADAALNAKYTTILACLKRFSDAGKPLVEAQRAWLRFRDAECRFQAGTPEDSGSARPMVLALCLQTTTLERSLSLDIYLTCHEGDLSCPTSACPFTPK